MSNEFLLVSRIRSPGFLPKYTVFFTAYDPDNLPCPKDLWSIPYEGNEKQLAPVYTNDYETKKPNGIWRCDLGAAAPEPRTMVSFGCSIDLEFWNFFIWEPPNRPATSTSPLDLKLPGAPEPSSTAELGKKTMDSGTLTIGDGKAGKKKPAPANEHALKTIAVDAQYVMATSVNAKKNKWTNPLRLFCFCRMFL